MSIIKRIAAKRADKERDRELEQKKLIAQILVDIREQREEFESVTTEYFNAAVEAARVGQDDYASELLETIVEIEEFVENLKYLDIKLKTSAITANAMSKLRTLPQALVACRGVFHNGPDFKKLGKDMSELLASLGTARDSFREFRKSMTRGSDPVYREVFGEPRKVEDPKYKQRLDDKKKALEARLTAISDKPSAVSPADCAVTPDDVASVDSIAAMLDDEKRKD